MLSIKHLVPEIVIKPPKEPKPIKQPKEPKIKQVKKKQKVYTIVEYNQPLCGDKAFFKAGKISYPIIEYKDTSININEKVSYPIIEYNDNNNKISYPIIKYEHKL